MAESLSRLVQCGSVRDRGERSILGRMARFTPTTLRSSAGAQPVLWNMAAGRGGLPTSRRRVPVRYVRIFCWQTALPIDADSMRTPSEWADAGWQS
jgi:hypothetical protein